MTAKNIYIDVDKIVYSANIDPPNKIHKRGSSVLPCPIRALDFACKNYLFVCDKLVAAEPITPIDVNPSATLLPFITPSSRTLGNVLVLKIKTKKSVQTRNSIYSYIIWISYMKLIKLLFF